MVLFHLFLLVLFVVVVVPVSDVVIISFVCCCCCCSCFCELGPVVITDIVDTGFFRLYEFLNQLSN